MNHIFIVGSHGYTNSYGGWETLVKGMADNWVDANSVLYVTEVVDSDEKPEHEIVNNVNCIRIKVKTKGSLQMVIANAKFLNRFNKYLKHYSLEKKDNVVLYVLGQRVGFLFFLKRNFFKKKGITIVKNSDGMGWKRQKYNFIEKMYSNIDDWFFNNFVMDYLVADAQAMLTAYKNERLKARRRVLNTRVIYYGTNEAPQLPGEMPSHVQTFFKTNNIEKDSYYLIINRFVPENSYELILKEFMESNTKCSFVVVSNQSKEKKYYKRLQKKINFESDKRIKLVGSIYDKELLQYLRQYARGYINGHTVGGTNPGLLEALATTNVNLIRDCSFSREGAGDTGFYFDYNHPLSQLIDQIDSMPLDKRIAIGVKAKERMKNSFSWEYVNRQYVELFNEIAKNRGI